MPGVIFSRKHGLQLQLCTAKILSNHAVLEQKKKAIQDVKEQKNKLDVERARLLNCLREVNEDRDKADLLEATLTKEISDLDHNIKSLQDGDYAVAKADVDKLRQELGQPPLPSLQATLEERSAQFLKEVRMQSEAIGGVKRGVDDLAVEGQPTGKRPRGRPKGSKNSKNKGKGTEAATGTAPAA